MNRTRATSREIFGFSTYLATDLVQILVAIETHSHFREVDNYVQRYGRPGNPSLHVWSWLIFDYLQLVDDLRSYRRKFIPVAEDRRAGLITGTGLGSSAVPLR
jgi:hypothetical protein